MTTETNVERREFGFLWQRGRLWWLRYRVNGKEHRESPRPALTGSAGSSASTI
jgi:hypothetical protein